MAWSTFSWAGEQSHLWRNWIRWNLQGGNFCLWYQSLDAQNITSSVKGNRRLELSLFVWIPCFKVICGKWKSLLPTSGSAKFSCESVFLFFPLKPPGLDAPTDCCYLALNQWLQIHLLPFNRGSTPVILAYFPLSHKFECFSWMRDAVAMYWGHTQKLPIRFKKGILA